MMDTWIRQRNNIDKYIEGVKKEYVPNDYIKGLKEVDG